MLTEKRIRPGRARQLKSTGYCWADSAARRATDAATRTIVLQML